VTQIRRLASSRSTKKPGTAGRAGTADERRLEDVLNAFRRILRALRIAAVDTQSRFKVSAAQLFVLDELEAAREPLSINELAERTMTDRSSVTGVVNRLVQHRFVTRSQATHDRRRIEVALTPAGAKLVKSAPPAPTMQLIRALQALSSRELKMLSITMRRLTQEMGVASDQGGFLFEDLPSRRSNSARPR
jgi:MarR family transcriptional regulator, organic hydroperoxide resistance regulator